MTEYERREYIVLYECDGDSMFDMETKERIVRCRDCKFCMAYMAGTYCDYMAHTVALDGFCAWGERKEGGE